MAKTTTLSKAIDDLIHLLDDVEDQHEGAKVGSEDRAYWQGKKDGMRTALALLMPERTTWKNLIESSPETRATDRQILGKMVQEAVFLIGEIQWAHHQSDRKIHPMSWQNMRRWRQWVASMAERFKLDTEGALGEESN